MTEHFDLDLSGLLNFEYDLKEAGNKLYNVMLKTASGTLTANEILKHHEFAITKLYISA